MGYGDDEKIWGGEILHSSYTAYERIYHLEEQIMVGGDRATYYPIRMFAGILSKVVDPENLREILENNYLDSFPGGYNEIQVLLVQLEKRLNLFETTSTGRILASLSSLLGFCSERQFPIAIPPPVVTYTTLSHCGSEPPTSHKHRSS